MNRIESHGRAEELITKNGMPKVERLLVDYPNLEGGYIEASASPKLCAFYSVFTLPAILVFAEGKEVIREARYLSFLDLNERIERYYSLLFG